MIVRELRDELAKLDQDAEIVVSVRVYTRPYSVAQCDIGDHSVDHEFGGAAIHISLPDNMHVVERKKA